jgi:O-antigen/teichoic acid export membrane protein
MSRLRRAFHGVVSSYTLLAATAIYSLASVPVALHYLDTERFGLWALMGTLAGYLTLIDAGMSSAAARLLIDHKDDPDGGNYGSLIKTGWLVSLVQALIIFLAGETFAGLFAHLMNISPALQAEFIELVHWQCGVLALSFAARMLNLMLGAHQRMDWVNYTGVIGLLVNFAVQWLLFNRGCGVLSLVGGTLAATLLSIALLAFSCQWLELLPKAGCWGRASWPHFQELFNYGKDVFLVAVGTQLIMASQIMVITSLLGLKAAAVWSVGLRVFNLLTQVVWRVSDMSMAALAEMLARGEVARLRDRYRSLAMLSFSFAGYVAVSFAVCNSLFVSAWTHGKIYWPAGNDWLLALWMVISAVVHCHNSFALMTKRVDFMRYIYFVEGVLFVASSCWVARWGGLTAIIICSIVSSTLFSGAYGVWRISRFFALPLQEIAWAWLQPLIKVLALYLPVAMLVWWLPLPLSQYARLVFNAVLAGGVGTLLFIRYGIPVSFQTEMSQRIPAWLSLILSKVLHKPAT